MFTIAPIRSNISVDASDCDKADSNLFREITSVKSTKVSEAQGFLTGVTIIGIAVSVSIL